MSSKQTKPWKTAALYVLGSGLQNVPTSYVRDTYPVKVSNLLAHFLPFLMLPQKRLYRKPVQLEDLTYRVLVVKNQETKSPNSSSISQASQKAITMKEYRRLTFKCRLLNCTWGRVSRLSGYYAWSTGSPFCTDCPFAVSLSVIASL